MPVSADEGGYFKLAEFWIENRGNHQGRQGLRQLRPGPQPVFRQKSLEGHAVRATLMATGLTALAAVNDREDIPESAGRLWSNMTGRRMHVNGGVGASREGEAFAGDYNLPNDGYLETCAAIGSGFFSRDMNLLAAMPVMWTNWNGRSTTPCGGRFPPGRQLLLREPAEAGKNRARWSWHVALLPADVPEDHGRDARLHLCRGPWPASTSTCSSAAGPSCGCRPASRDAANDQISLAGRGQDRGRAGEAREFDSSIRIPGLVPRGLLARRSLPGHRPADSAVRPVEGQRPGRSKTWIWFAVMHDCIANGKPGDWWSWRWTCPCGG